MISFVLFSCAQVGSLTGGEKDVSAPKLIKSTPVNGSTNFNESKIELMFNEFVQLNNLNQQLIISPPVKNLPKSSLKGKTLTLTFDTLLNPNTTYSLFFGDAIQDYNERNTWQENSFVFSTGNTLDSLEIKGTIHQSLSFQPENGMFVMLYKEINDSVVLKKLPDYFAKTNKDGNFTLKNIHQGRYKIFALQDMNADYLYNLPNEKIAFYNSTLVLDSNLNNLELGSFLERKEKQSVFKKEFIHDKAVQLSFRSKAKNPVFEINDANNKIHHQQKFKNGDSVVVWLKDLNNNDSLVILAKEGDYQENIVLHPNAIEKYNNIKLKPDFKGKAISVLPNDSLKVAFNFPLEAIDTSKVKLTQDSVNLLFSAQIKDYQMLIQTQGESNKISQLKIEPNGIKDIYGRGNTDTLKIPFVLMDENAVAQLLLQIDIKEVSGPYVLQLISSKGDIIKEENFNNNKVSFSYKNLAPNEVKLKLLLDENNNQLWDTGNYFEHRQPEKIVFYEKPLTLRANWELEVLWNVELK